MEDLVTRQHHRHPDRGHHPRGSAQRGRRDEGGSRAEQDPPAAEPAARGQSAAPSCSTLLPRGGAVGGADRVECRDGLGGQFDVGRGGVLL